ncbi:MAG TPA: peptidylprolyl isomerase [Gaiellaceae bacterium]|jgi:peptidyl-prolyl cis-trans isomerase C
MKKIPLTILCMAALVLLVAACGGGGSKNVPGDAVAVVGGTDISKSDWEAVIDQARRNRKATKQPFPKQGTAELATLRTNAVLFLIQKSEYFQEADKLGIKVTDKDVEQRLDAIKKQYYDNPPGQPRASKDEIEKRYQQALKQQGFTDEEARAGLKLTLIREKLYESVTKDVKVSDSDVRAYYNSHKEQYQTPAQPESRNVRHILVKTKALADRLYAQLKANPSLFPKLARKYSTDTSSKVNGGTLPGGAIKGRTVPPFDKVAFSIPTKKISEPVHTQFGWHIIQALGPIKPGTPAKPTPFNQVETPIRQQLVSQKKNEKFQSWLDDIKKKYCKTIAYQRGYKPAPGQDPCTSKGSSTGAATTQ